MERADRGALDDVTIRDYRDGDEIALVNVFDRSVREVASWLYGEEHVEAWASGTRDPAAWGARMRCDRDTFVAERDGVAIGWIELEHSGHLDFLYCAPEAAGRGVAALLYSEVEGRAVARGTRMLTSDASLFAERFLTRRGWRVDRREVVVRNGVEIPRARMSKLLLSP